MDSTKNPAAHRRIRRLGLAAAAAGLLAGTRLLCRRGGCERRVRWYHLAYRLAYRLGLTVWQRPKPPADLVMLVEGPPPWPPGRALDLGCGTGTDTIYLAKRGWQVTGVDMVPRALAIARRNATAAGVAPQLVQGDVTHLHDLGVSDAYTLLLDFGCFHTLPNDQRDAYVTSVSQVAAPGAILLLYGFRRPPKAAPMHAGITPDEIQQRFNPPGWQLLHAGPALANTAGISMPHAEERFELWHFQLQHTTK